MDRLIFHIDVNSAFLSWEAARRVSLGMEDLRLIPSAIGGDRDKRTGVILAKSIPAKKYGVKTGEPVARALIKCPELVLAKPNFKLYEKCSRQFMDICISYAPVVEKYSIDECFLDMTGTHLIYPDPIKTAHEIKNKIRDTLGFTVNVGIGSNKLLAKMASDFEKPDKVHTLFTHEIEEKMWNLPVGELFSVGRSTAEKLEKAFIKTIGDLARADLSRIQYLVGVKLGKQIHDYARGIDDSEVLSEREEPKGYSVSTTLEEDVINAEQACEILMVLSDSVTSRMRADGAKACCVSVTIRDNDFKNRSHQKMLSVPTDITQEIIRTSKLLFEELWDGTPLRLIGIALTKITKESSYQLSLFDNEMRDKERRVDTAMDDIRRKYGSSTIMWGSSFKSSLNVGKKYKAQLDDKK